MFFKSHTIRLFAVSLAALVAGYQTQHTSAAVVLYEQSFDTDTANAAATYPDFTLTTGGPATVVGGILNLGMDTNTVFTRPGFLGDVVIEADMGGMNVAIGSSRSEFVIGSVNALFHVGYPGGAFRLEGGVFQSNLDMGFQPAANVLHHLTVRSFGNGQFSIAIQNGSNPSQVFTHAFTHAPSVGQPIGFRWISTGTGLFDNLSVRYAADLVADPAVNGVIDLSGGGLFEGLLKLTNAGFDASSLEVTGFSITGADADLFDLPSFTPATLIAGASANTSYDLFSIKQTVPGTYSALLTLQTNIGDFTFTLQSVVVPEPNSLGMLLLGCVVLAAARRKRRTESRR